MCKINISSRNEIETHTLWRFKCCHEQSFSFTTYGFVGLTNSFVDDKIFFILNQAWNTIRTKTARWVVLLITSAGGASQHCIMTIIMLQRLTGLNVITKSTRKFNCFVERIQLQKLAGLLTQLTDFIRNGLHGNKRILTHLLHLQWIFFSTIC